jgi:hypothetical protein
MVQYMIAKHAYADSLCVFWAQFGTWN